VVIAMVGYEYGDIDVVGGGGGGGNVDCATKVPIDGR
jgi:hypothetical protein